MLRAVKRVLLQQRGQRSPVRARLLLLRQHSLEERRKNVDQGGVGAAVGAESVKLRALIGESCQRSRRNMSGTVNR